MFLFNFQASGNWDLGNNVDKPSKMKSVLDLKLPWEKLSNLKLELSRKLLSPTEENDLLEHGHSAKLTYNNDKTVATNSYLRLQGLQKGLEEASTGKGSLSLNILELPQLKMEGNYKFTPTEEKKTATVDLSLNYGDKVAKLQSNNEYRPDLAVVNMNVKCDLPLEKVRNLDMQLVYKVFHP